MSNLTSLTEEASCASFASLYPLAPSNIVSPATDQQPQKIKKKRNLPGNPGNTIFASKKDSFVTHRAFCDALAEETARLSAANNVPILMSSSTTSPLLATPPPPLPDQPQQHHPFSILSNPNFFSTKLPEEHKQKNVENDPQFRFSLSPCDDLLTRNPNLSPNYGLNNMIKRETNEISHINSSPLSTFYQDITTPPAYTNSMMTSSPFRSLPQGLATSSAHLSATALLQKAATMGPKPATMSRNVGHVGSPIAPDYADNYATWQHKSEHGMTRDFLGLTGSGNSRNVDVNVNVNVNGRNLVSFTRGIELPPYQHDHSRMRTHLGFGAERRPGSETWGNY
uniref:BIRD-IDD transcription factor fourth C2HC zinc finger domain-containing protein n=1 Tax=Daucus carota subsp. sativus TaxID=79200 RepID=A0A166CGK6_DAUCS